MGLLGLAGFQSRLGAMECLGHALAVDPGEPIPGAAHLALDREELRRRLAGGETFGESPARWRPGIRFAIGVARTGRQVLEILGEKIGRPAGSEGGVHLGPFLGHLQDGVEDVGGVGVLDAIGGLALDGVVAVVPLRATAPLLGKADPSAAELGLALDDGGLAALGALAAAAAPAVLALHARAAAGALADARARGDVGQRAGDLVLAVTAGQVTCTLT